MSGSSYEREYRRHLEANGWTVFRSAGSLAIDLIAIRENLPLKMMPVVMLIEVKAFSGDVFRVTKTKRNFRQWQDMLKLAKKFEVLYALRKKGQKKFRVVRPADLAKPYHWSKMAQSGISLPPTS